jgi:uncharacterized protein DUF3617
MKVWKKDVSGLLWGLAVVLVAGIAPLRSQAQSALSVKPGLWQMQTGSGAGSGGGAPAMPALPPDAEARIAALPPAQQAQVRAAMAGAMGGGGAKPAGMTTQACIAPKTNMDSLLNQAQQRSAGGMQCSFTNRVQTAQGASYDISCTGPMGSAQGHTSYHVADDEHFSSTTHLTINGKSSQGQSMTMTHDVSTTGTYVSADCGDVKPMGTAPAK